MTEFKYVTTNPAIEIYESSTPIFAGILRELRELSRKKPDATMSTGKVRIVNRVLNDVLVILKDESVGKYLEILEDQSLPQVSDAVLVMVQFESALAFFYQRYNRRDNFGGRYWNTEERVTTWDETSESSDGGQD